jgi:CRP-like cAMP-binding protein
MNITKLLLHFDNYLSLDASEIDALQKVIIEKNVKKKQYILQENDVCKHYTFVLQGLFKMYATDKNGIEHIIQFAAENEWIEDIGSLHGKRPSLLNAEAIEASIVLQIDNTDLHHLFTEFPKLERNFRVIIENKFIDLENRMLQNISFSGEEKYLSFLEQFPHISNRLPNTMIASYLGITPEFLSKIRSNLSKKLI